MVGDLVDPSNGDERGQHGCATLVESGSTLVNNDVTAATGAAARERGTSIKLRCFLGHMRFVKVGQEVRVGEHDKPLRWSFVAR